MSGDAQMGLLENNLAWKFKNQEVIILSYLQVWNK